MNAFKVAFLTLSVFSTLMASVTIFSSRSKSVGTIPSKETAAIVSQPQPTGSLPQSSPSPVPSPTISVQQSMTVGQAYQRIPHAQTTFSPAQTQVMNTAESQSANDLFTWVDFSIVERVTMMDNMQRGQQYSPGNYAVILTKLNSIAVPEKLTEPKSLIIAAINEQKSYFEQQSRAGQSQPINSQDPLIQSAHQKLFTAYNKLIELYPQESEHNKKAFFDHLCALDFV
jgi:hypothetical protein